jgi:hypothetical protein
MGVRRAATGCAVACALIGLGAAAPADAAPNVQIATRMPVPLDPDPGMPTGPDDPRCAAMLYLAQCQGAPAAAHAPMGPADPACIAMPADPVCAGGPFGIPAAAAPAPAIAQPPIEGPRIDGPRIDPPPIEEPRAPVMPDERIGGGMPEEHIGGGMPGRI